MAKQHNTQTTKTRKKESRTATATTGTTTTTTTLGELNSNNINTKATCPNNKNNNTNDSGFQWEGPSIFDHNHDHAPAHEGVLPPNMMDEMNTNTKENNDNDDDHDHSILAVPMLPGVSMEPIYRQHRSLSFSMGQDPTFFGYNDYSDDDETTSTPTDAKPTSTTTNNNNKAYKNSLETMAEDDEEQDEEEHAVFVGEDEFNAYRMRSKSSGAALNMLSSSQQGYLFHRYVGRGSAEHEAQEAEQAWNDITEKTAPPPATSTLGSQGHMYSNTTTTTATTDPVQRLAEQIEAMQFQQLQQQQQQSAAPPPPPGFNNMPASYPMGMPPPPLHHHQHHPHPPPPEMYSHPHHPPPPPHYYSEHHPHETTTNDTRMYQEGKGVALHQLPAETLLYMIEFKAGRTDFFYVIPPSPNNPSSSPPPPHLGDLVIVEADRGKDLGKVAKENLTSEEILNMKKQQQHQQHQEEHGSSPSLSTHHDESQSHTSSSSSSSPSSSHESQQQEMKLSDIQIKRIYRQALPDEISILLLKNQDEQRALAVCQQKTKQRKLPMEVVDAEYQWDRRKLTFYFVAERRIDFRELVRELFKIYKTRIWMCAVNPNNTN